MLIFSRKSTQALIEDCHSNAVLPSIASQIRGAVVRIAKAKYTSQTARKSNTSQLTIHIMALTKQIRQGNKILGFESYKN